MERELVSGKSNVLEINDTVVCLIESLLGPWHDWLMFNDTSH